MSSPGSTSLVGGVLALTATPASDRQGALRVAPRVGDRSGGLVLGGAFSAPRRRLAP